MEDKKSPSWDESTKDKFKHMIEKVPVFLRGMAEETVTKKAQDIVAKEGRSVIKEKDMVVAFFEATPFGFHGPMKSDMEDLNIDYTQYGYEK